MSNTDETVQDMLTEILAEWDNRTQVRPSEAKMERNMKQNFVAEPGVGDSAIRQRILADQAAASQRSGPRQSPASRLPLKIREADITPPAPLPAIQPSSLTEDNIRLIHPHLNVPVDVKKSLVSYFLRQGYRPL